jgi:predicted Zn-dependent protease
VANDFAEAPVISFFSDAKSIELPKTHTLKSQAEMFSSVLKEKKDLRETKVQVGATTLERWYVNSEGTKTHTLRNLAYIDVDVEAQSDDGIMVADGILFVAQRPEKLPHLSQVKQEINKLGDRVQTMREAPLIDDFIGPVLFEGEASAELASRVLASSFISYRKPISEGKDWFGKISKTSLRRKLGRRVISTNFNIIDDPTIDSFEGQYLCGNRAIDLEGVKVQKVQLVENGILKTLLTTRTPDKKLPMSNGHALSENMLHEGEYKPAITNLFIEYQDGLKEKELKDRLIQAINDQGIDYGLIIRRISAKNISTMEDMFDFFMNLKGNKSSIDDPIIAFRVFPDGREEPVRIGSLKNVELSAYKDILAAGRDRYVRNVWKMGDLSSIIAPSILFEEIIIEKPEADIYKPPLIESPLLSLEQ